MVHISHNLSHAILQSLKDTAHRFENSEGGKKDWASLLEEIYSSLSPNIPNLDGEVITDLKEFCLQDCGDYNIPDPTNLPYPAILNRHGQPIWRWSIETAESRRIRFDRLPDTTMEPQIITSRQTAWFLERLRSLCIETAEERLGQRGTALDLCWPRNPEHFQSQWAFLTPPDDAHPVHWRHQVNVSSTTTSEPMPSGPTISWRTMIEYLQFIREHSNWTTPIGLSYIERIDKSHDWLMEGNLTGVPGSATTWRGGMLARFPDRLLHEMFNVEQGEELGEAFYIEQEEQDRVERVAFIQGLDESDARAREVEKKKGQVREILDLLEKQAEKSELSEGKYNEYAGLLMEVFQGMGSK
jgi:hypothetical protein